MSFHEALDQPLETLRIIEDQFGSSIRDLESHGLAGGNQEPPISTCALSKMSIDPVPVISPATLTTATEVPPVTPDWMSPFVQDIVIDL